MSETTYAQYTWRNCLDREEVASILAREEEELARLRIHYNMLSPAVRLPSELISKIFFFCVAHNRQVYWKEYRRDLIKPYSWIRVTHVCRHWRNVALHTAALWTYIALTRPDCVREMLLRSKTMPLVIGAPPYDKVSKKSLISLLQIAFKEHHRIRGILFCFSQAVHESLLKFPDIEMPMLHTLRSLGYYSACSLPFRIMSSAPLKEICLTEYSSSFILGLFRPSITSLELTNVQQPFSLTDILDALDGMPSLQRLIFDDAISDEDGYKNWGKLPEATRAISLPELDVLHLTESGPGVSSTMLLTYLHFPVSCTISAAYNSLWDWTEIHLILPTFQKVFMGNGLIGSMPPITSLAFRSLSTEYAYVTFEAWTELHPESACVLDDPEPHFELQFEVLQLSHREFTTWICLCLPSSDVLSKLTFERSPIPKLLDPFGNVETLVVKWDRESALPDVLSPLENTIMFPHLKTIQLHCINFRQKMTHPLSNSPQRTYIDEFRDALSSRKAHTANLDLLTLNKVSCISGMDVAQLKEIVPQVEWDGRVSMQNDPNDQSDWTFRTPQRSEDENEGSGEDEDEMDDVEHEDWMAFYDI